MPPHPEVSSKAPFTNAINIRLDDIQKELQVLMSRRPDDEKRAIKFQFIPEWATKDLRSAFRCLNCELYSPLDVSPNDQR